MHFCGDSGYLSVYEKKEKIRKLPSTIQRYCFCKRISIVVTGSEYWHQHSCLVSPPCNIHVPPRSRNFSILVNRVSFIGCANHHNLQGLTTVYTLCKEYIPMSCVVIWPSHIHVASRRSYRSTTACFFYMYSFLCYC